MNLFETSILGVNIIGIGWLVFLQYKIIGGYERVFKSTDIKRLADFYEKLDELNKKHTVSVAHQTVDAVLQDFESKIGTQYNEMATFINSIYLSLSEEEGKEFIQEHFPHSKELFPYTSNARDVIARSVYGK